MTGYKTPAVVKAIQEQAAKMLHTSTLYLIEGQIELAENSPRCRESRTPRCSSPTADRKPTTPH